MSAILIVLTTGLLSGYGFYQYLSLRSSNLAYLNTLSESISARLTENLVAPIWDLNSGQIEKVVISEMHEKSVLAIQVINAKERLLIGKGRDPQWKIINVQEILPGDVIISRQPIMKGEEKLGTVTLSLTKQFIQADLRQAIKTLVVTIVALNIALLLGIILSLRQIIIRPLASLLKGANTITTGDLTQLVFIRRQDEMGALANAFRRMIAKLIQVIGEVKDAVNMTVKSSQELSANAEALSKGAAQQAAATEEASASMQEMAANIRQNADNARQTEILAKQAVKYAEESSNVVAETVMAMQQIVSQISVIQDIAQQTRLLSLNATIEASRAQEFGKSFGVVAHEVRELADTTRTAAEQIVHLTKSSLDVSHKAGDMLTILVPNIQKTSNLVQEISAANAEQLSGVEQINKAIQQLDQATQQNAAAADQVASSAEVLASQATQLKQTIAFFTIPEQLTDSLLADTDPLNAQQMSSVKGVSKQAMGTQVKSMPAAPPAEFVNSDWQDNPTSSTAMLQKYGPDMSSKSNESRNTLDDDFERY